MVNNIFNKQIIVKMHNIRYKEILIIILILIVIGCKKNDNVSNQIKAEKLSINFLHKVGNDSLQKNALIYQNAAGNQFEINEIKYFISDLILYPHNLAPIKINQWKTIHYIDIDIPSTLVWHILDDIPNGIYDSVSFIFGLNENSNLSFMYVNPPEINMFWPEILGGGYHYMMINGKWKAANNQIKPFNCHLGIGQLYSGTTYSTDSITGFVHNYFKVNLKTPDLVISPEQIAKLNITLNINSWFATPNIYNHDIWGGDIMQKQAAMQMIKENGFDVFSIDK